LLSFAYVYFLESGLFNGLQPIQIKKFPAAISGCARLYEPAVHDVHVSSFRACQEPGSIRRLKKAWHGLWFLARKSANFLLASIPPERRDRLGRSVAATLASAL
jgi:hypothetical protein